MLEPLDRCRRDSTFFQFTSKRLRDFIDPNHLRTVKYAEVYLKAYSGGKEANAALDDYFRFYNTQRPHQALGYRTPAEGFYHHPGVVGEKLFDRSWPENPVLIPDS